MKERRTDMIKIIKLYCEVAFLVVKFLALQASLGLEKGVRTIFIVSRHAYRMIKNLEKDM